MNDNEEKERFKAMYFTIILVLLICFLWWGLELLFYGEIQPRVVDDIVMLVFLPFIYLTCRYIQYQHRK